MANGDDAVERSSDVLRGQGSEAVGFATSDGGNGDVGDVKSLVFSMQSWSWSSQALHRCGEDRRRDFNHHLPVLRFLQDPKSEGLSGRRSVVWRKLISMFFFFTSEQFECFPGIY